MKPAWQLAKRGATPSDWLSSYNFLQRLHFLRRALLFPTSTEYKQFLHVRSAGALGAAIVVQGVEVFGCEMVLARWFVCALVAGFALVERKHVSCKTAARSLQIRTMFVLKC